MSRGSLFVICAPSGTGKTTMVHKLLEQDSRLQVSVSYTTRASRQGERDGHDYYFVSQKNFMEMQANNAFIESAQVYGHYYGTEQSAVETKLTQGVDIVLEIDWQGAHQITQLMPEAVIIGLVPPSIPLLEQRLKQRAKDSEQIIAKRMQQAKYEIRRQMQQRVDYVVINDDFDTALAQLQTIIAASRLRVSVNLDSYQRILNS